MHVLSKERASAALPATGPIPAARPDFSGGEVHVAGGRIQLDGEIDTSGNNGKGGAVLAVADHALTLTADVALEVTGSDGGLVLLGGDYQRGARYWSEPLATTARTDVAQGTTIRADDVAGAGGNAEVSGRGAVLEFTGLADLTATSGAYGTLLIDPYNVAISTGANTSGFTATDNAAHHQFYSC